MPEASLYLTGKHSRAKNKLGTSPKTDIGSMGQDSHRIISHNYSHLSFHKDINTTTNVHLQKNEPKSFISLSTKVYIQNDQTPNCYAMENISRGI